MQKGQKAVNAAVKKLKIFLNELFEIDKDDDLESYVELFGVGPWGVRIAEMGIVRKDHSGGASHMRSEAGNAILFLRCEDLLMQWAWHCGPDDDIEEYKNDIREWMKEGKRCRASARSTGPSTHSRSSRRSPSRRRPRSA